ncbi:MAG: septal ring lytic transglycosylase RlpA family protein [Patescibacteria group bacterium]
MYLRLLLAAVVFCLHLSPAHAERMVASYYAAPTEKTIAHRSLPFGTRLRLTNPQTGKSVEGVVRDRGPGVPGVLIDVSHAFASLLGFTKAGHAPLEVQNLGVDPSQARPYYASVQRHSKRKTPTRH